MKEKKIYKRRAVFDKLKSGFKEGAFIEVTEWKNGEGVDVSIDDGRESNNFCLTYSAIEQLVELTNILNDYVQNLE